MIEIHNWLFDPTVNKLKGVVFNHTDPDMNSRIDPVVGKYIETSTVIKIEPGLVTTKNNQYKLCGSSIVSQPRELLPQYERMAEEYKVPVSMLFMGPKDRILLECSKCHWVHFRVYREDQGNKKCFKCGSDNGFTETTQGPPTGCTIQGLFR